MTKWGKMDPNETPQTLVDTFDQANSNSILESVCSSHNFVDLRYPVSTCTAECSLSGMKRLYTPLRRTMTDERLSCMLQFCTYTTGNKEVIDNDGIGTEFCPFEGYTSRPLLVSSLMTRHCFALFCRKHCTLTITPEMG